MILNLNMVNESVKMIGKIAINQVLNFMYFCSLVNVSLCNNELTDRTKCLL